MNHFFVFLSLALLSQASLAQDTLKCQWQQKTDHAPGFYREASITMTFEKEQVTFQEDTFLFRTYEPCWTGGWSSCAFGFTYEGNSWQIVEKVKDSFVLTAPGFYWDAQLEMTFDKSPSELKRSEVTKALISGDDGDGVAFYDESFLCQKF